MSLGELVLVAIRSGVITQPEIDWLLARQDGLSRAEQAAAQRLGRLLDAGSINLGCRVSARRLHHRQVLQDWMEPLGRRRQGRFA
jgi:hypothetical protein